VEFQYPPEKQTMQQIEIEKVRTTIRRLKTKKAPEPNKVPNKIIKIYKKILAPYLQHLFNACLKQGTHPRIYKKAKTIVLKKPEKKVGDYIKAGAYKPITLLNTVGKILKIILAQKLSGLAKTHKLLPSAQMGAKKKQSTQSALKLLTK